MMMHLKMAASGLLTVAALAFAGCGGHDDDRMAADTAHVDAMAHEHAGQAPTASAGAMTEPASPVTGETVQYNTTSAAPISGYYATPVAGDSTRPGLIVVHEWWGLNDNIRAATRRLAGEGYSALAVDLYGGQSADTPDGAKTLMMTAMGNPDAAMANMKEALAYLTRRGARKIGIVGWCFGGGMALQGSLAMGKAVDATVIYYGQPETDPKRLVNLKSPLLAHYGEADQGIPVEKVREMEAALKQLGGKSVEIHIYPGAKHAFANPSGPAYDSTAASQAWTRSTAFFAEHLK